MTTKAKRRAKVPADQQPSVINTALLSMRAARDALRICGCKNAADYVARALKSAEGALRHAQRLR